MTRSWTFEKGLHDLGNGLWAYLQPDGGWGYSNAGLIKDGDASLVVDTLFDEPLTAEMFRAMEDAAGVGAADVTFLVNTHGNGDHVYGNTLAVNAEIIATKATAEEMAEAPPALLDGFMKAAPTMGLAGAYIERSFKPFDFANATLTMPHTTFEGEKTVMVGSKEVRLIEVGPAHTRGDTLVYVPGDKVVFAADILFINCTPIMWDGPIANWIAACDRILAMDVDVIVPGHGPITDKDGVRRVQDYLNFVDREARKRFDAGMDPVDAAKDINLGPFESWGEAERIVVNVDTLYKEYRGESSPPDYVKMFGLMAEIDAARRA